MQGAELVVYTTGERVGEEGEVREGGWRGSLHHSSLPLPISTLALAVGVWPAVPLPCLHPATRLAGPPALVARCRAGLGRYLVAALAAVQQLLGPYPLPRCDVVIVHRSFSGLGLASPNLIFISPR